MTVFFFKDGYADKPKGLRGELEERIRNLRTAMWSAPEDKNELLGMIEAAERELRKLDESAA